MGSERERERERRDRKIVFGDDENAADVLEIAQSAAAAAAVGSAGSAWARVRTTQIAYQFMNHCGRVPRIQKNRRRRRRRGRTSLPKFCSASPLERVQSNADWIRKAMGKDRRLRGANHSMSQQRPQSGTLLARPLPCCPNSVYHNFAPFSESGFCRTAEYQTFRYIL